MRRPTCRPESQPMGQARLGGPRIRARDLRDSYRSVPGAAPRRRANGPGLQPHTACDAVIFVLLAATPAPRATRCRCLAAIDPVRSSACAASLRLLCDRDMVSRSCASSLCVGAHGLLSLCSCWPVALGPAYIQSDDNASFDCEFRESTHFGRLHAGYAAARLAAVTHRVRPASSSVSIRAPRHGSNEACHRRTVRSDLSQCR